MRFYGGLLIFFHFGTTYLMGITFAYHVYAWGLFFIITPLASKQTNIVYQLFSIPIIGDGLRIMFPSKTLIEKQAPNLEATIVYDGECPFCSNYVKYMKLRTALKKLTLVNARDNNHPLVKTIKQKNFDLDEGMVIVISDAYYYGSDAINMITLLSSRDSFFSAFNYILFANPKFAKYTYPIYKFGRRVTLNLLGRPKIDDVKS